LQPLENAPANFLLPALFDHKCCPLERDILALPVRKGRIGLANLCIEAPLEYLVSKKVTAPLADQIQYMNFLIIRKHKNGTERISVTKDEANDRTCLVERSPLIVNSRPSVRDRLYFQQAGV
jgi:hypothetical protein